MPFKIIKGDLFDYAKKGVIAHGVNCRNAFGSGFAGQIAKKYPRVKERYHVYPFKELGNIQWVLVSENLCVANCFIQDNYGLPFPKLERHIKYSSLVYCLEELEGGVTDIHMPVIGCGLAGGDWKIVKELLKDIFEDSDTNVTVYIPERDWKKYEG